MTSTVRKLFFLCLTLNVVSVAVSFAAFKATPFLTKVDVKNYLDSFNITIHVESTSNENRINVEMITSQNIPQPRVIVSLWLDVGTGVLQKPFYNQTIDICTLIKNPNTHRLVQIVYRELRRHGNLPTGCPIPITVYKFRGISTSQMRLPTFFTLDFMLDIIGLAGTTKIRTFESRWYGVVHRLMPILTKAKVEGSKYVNTSVAIFRHGSLHNFTMELVVHVLSTLDDLRMNVGYYVRLRDSDNWIYNKTYDFCAFLERPSIDRFSAIVVEDLKHHGKVPPRCPVKPERIVYKNVTLNRIKLPSFLPETSFGFTVSCLRGPRYEPVFRSYWYGRMRRVMV
uniref:Uncharacterized protein n=1 Tax=Anopheles minimus TaxID=112268 RepID=A0A182W213_9DIPT